MTARHARPDRDGVVVFATTTSRRGGIDAAIRALLLNTAPRLPGAPHLVRVWDLPQRSSSVDGRAARIGARWAKATFVIAALRTVREQRPRLIVCAHLSLLPVALGIGRLTGTPVVAWLYGREAWTSQSRLTRACAARVGLHAISAFTRDGASRALQVAPSTISILHVTLTPDRFASLLRIEPEPIPGRILCVSRLTPECRYKGPEVLVRAMAHLAKEAAQAELRIVGEGADRAHLEELAHQLGVSDRVHLLGGLSDAEVDEELRLAQVFALPSRANLREGEGDGFGLVLLEASLAGVPCIAGEGGTTEAVSNGVGGWHVDPRDPLAIANVIAAAVRSPEQSAAMGLAARRWAAEHFAPASQCEEFMALYDAVAAAPTALSARDRGA